MPTNGGKRVRGKNKIIDKHRFYIVHRFVNSALLSCLQFSSQKRIISTRFLKDRSCGGKSEPRERKASSGKGKGGRGEITVNANKITPWKKKEQKKTSRKLFRTTKSELIDDKKLMNLKFDGKKSTINKIC